MELLNVTKKNDHLLIDVSGSDVSPFYQALVKFHRILESEESQFRFQLQRGDLLLLDNERVLHGRIDHSIGARHLQGCYADRDGFLSTLRVLEKSEV